MGTKLAIGIDIEPFVRQAITRNLNREEKKRLEIQKKQIKIIIEELKFLQQNHEKKASMLYHFSGLRIAVISASILDGQVFGIKVKKSGIVVIGLGTADLINKINHHIIITKIAYTFLSMA